MALESKVRERFLEGSCSILSEDELKSWWEDDNMSVLHECLQTMVNNGYLGSRPVSAGSTETTIYWLEMKGRYVCIYFVCKLTFHCDCNYMCVLFLFVDQPIVATPGSVRPISGSLRQRLKRSRPSFVSPLLSNSSSDESGGKRPKLNSTPSNLERSQTVPCGDASPCMTSGSIVRGKLDFTSLTSTSATSVTDMSEQTANRDAVSTGAAVYKTDCVIDNKYTVSGVQLKTLLGEKDSLQIQLTEKKEELRKLRMVKTYRTKVCKT